MLIEVGALLVFRLMDGLFWLCDMCAGLPSLNLYFLLKQHLVAFSLKNSSNFPTSDGMVVRFLGFL